MKQKINQVAKHFTWLVLLAVLALLGSFDMPTFAAINPTASERLVSSGSNGPGGVATNLQLWLKADAGTNTIIDGSDVTTWSDQSSNSYTATDNTVDAPTYQNESADLFNFNPILRFDGIDDALNLSGDYIYSTNDGLNIFAVVRPASDSTGSFDFLFDFGSNSSLGYGLAYSSDNSFFYTPLSHGGAGPQLAHTRGARGTVVTGRIDFGNQMELSFDGGTVISANISTSQLTSSEINESPVRATNHGPVMIGQQSKSFGRNGRMFQGDYAEVVVYDDDLSLADRNQVESYLAIKYGITLTGTQAISYTLSSGTVVWDADLNAIYHHDVAGIAKDDSSMLAQARSKSINDDALVTISGTISTDHSALLWGNNDGTTALDQSAYLTMARVWKVAENGTVGSISVSVPDSTGALYLLSDSDTDFSDATAYALTDDGNGNLTADVDFTDGQFFTFAQNAPESPGGIGTNLQLWLKADAGVTTSGVDVTAWNDQSGNGHQYSAGTTKPILTNEAINGNPATTWPGNQDRLTTPDMTYPDWKLFVIFKGQDNGPVSVLLANNDVSINYEEWHNRNRLGMSVQCTNSLPSCGNYASTLNKPDGQVALFEYAHSSSSNNIDIAYTASGTAQSTSLNTNHTNRPLGINQLGNKLKGDLAEVIVYNSASLTVAQEQQIKSYLALKYGITLESNVNYLDSNGATIWDATANSAYHHDLAGIGRDDSSALAQQKSKSVNDDALVTIDNGGAFSANSSFLIWGNNNDSTDLNLTAGGFDHMSRIWKVQETGSIGTVSISIPDSVTNLLIDATGSIGTVIISIPDSVDVTNLLIDADGDFSSGATSIPLISSGGTLSATVDFSTGEFFTFGKTALAVDLASFTAEADTEQVRIQWATVSEQDNLGFNLYRATSADGEQIRLNSDLIPAQAPGSGQGSTYEFVDLQVTEGESYFYWLQDVDINGNSTRHGPVSATANVPTAITLEGFTIDVPTISLWTLMALMLTLLMGGWVLRRNVR